MEEHWRYSRLSEQDGDAAGEPLPSVRRPKKRIVLALVILAAGIVVVGWWRRSGPVDRGRDDRPNVARAAREGDSPEAATLRRPREPAPEQRPTSPPDPPLPKTVPALMEEAEQVVGRLAQRFANNPFALDCMAKTQFYLGNSTAAREYWDRCLELDPRAAFAYEGLGRVAAAKGDYQQAAALLRKAVDLCPELPDTTWLSDTACQLADVLLKLGSAEEAKAVLEDLVRVNPESARGHLLLGQLHLQSGQYEKAKEAFQQVIRIQPASSHAHFGLANALVRTGERDKSAEHLERFKELRTKESTVRTGIRAKDEEPRVLARTVAKTYAHAGQIYYNHGDLREAERHWRRAAMLSPQDTVCRTFLAGLYQESNRLPEAIETYKQLAAIQPANPAHPWRLGILSIALGQFEAAEAAFKSVVELAPGSPQGYAALAGLYLESDQKLLEAKRLAQEAVRLAPVAPHYALLSRACARTGDQAGAMSAARKAGELPADNSEGQRQEVPIEPGKSRDDFRG